jgi:hypothetical protein
VKASRSGETGATVGGGAVAVGEGAGGDVGDGGTVGGVSVLVGAAGAALASIRMTEVGVGDSPEVAVGVAGAGTRVWMTITRGVGVAVTRGGAVGNDSAVRPT